MKDTRVNNVYRFTFKVPTPYLNRGSKKGFRLEPDEDESRLIIEPQGWPIVEPVYDPG